MAVLGLLEGDTLGCMEGDELGSVEGSTLGFIEGDALGSFDGMFSIKIENDFVSSRMEIMENGSKSQQIKSKRFFAWHDFLLFASCFYFFKESK